MNMNDKADIEAVKKVRPDLDDNQADEVLSFLQDMYSQESYVTSSERAFKAAASLMYGEAV
jgi:hypothetical protein